MKHKEKVKKKREHILWAILKINDNLGICSFVAWLFLLRPGD